MSFQTELAAAGLDDLGKPGSPEWQAKTYLSTKLYIDWEIERGKNSSAVQKWAIGWRHSQREYWDRMSPEAQRIARQLEGQQREEIADQVSGSNEAPFKRRSVSRQHDHGREQRLGSRPVSPYDRSPDALRERGSIRPNGRGDSYRGREYYGPRDVRPHGSPVAYDINDWGAPRGAIKSRDPRSVRGGGFGDIRHTEHR